MADPTIVPGVNTTVPVAEPGKQAEPQNSQPTVIPGLEKFVGEKGALDASKLGTSYLEAEKAMRQQMQENAQLKQALTAMTESLSGARQVEAPKPPDTETELKTFVANPREYVAAILEEMGKPLAKEVAMTALTTKHPELKDDSFAKEVGSWVQTLPEQVRSLEDTFEGADFLVNLYKTQKGKAANTVVAPAATTIAPGRTSQSTGQTFSSREIRALMVNNPREYQRRQPEFEKAYSEGRVID
jgi:hypothetical protein